MSKRNEVVKEITDILQLADTLAGLVCLFKINRKTNQLNDGAEMVYRSTFTYLLI